MLALVPLIAAGAVLWRSGWLPAQLAPRKVIVTGCDLTTPASVLGQLDFAPGDSYLTLWRGAGAARRSRAQDPSLQSGSSQRWLREVSVSPSWGGVALVQVTERSPVLGVSAGKSAYWLCDDGRLVPVEEETDHGGVFAQLLKLPQVMLPADPGVGKLAAADELLLAVEYCRQSLPGAIAEIEVTADGEFVLYDSGRLPIHLGKPQDLQRKISALPKALRVCEKDRDKLEYLDASDPRIFYQRWRRGAVGSDQ
ncbi:hypothetical protein IIA79_05445 [bacterium]|nr:hypothetical protein [bacterium]